MTSAFSFETKLKGVVEVESTNHQKYQFGILYPSHVHGIGSPNDLIAFFEAILLVTDQCESDYPFLCALRRKPVFGMNMLSLFEEVKKLRLGMKEVPVTSGVLVKLGLSDRKTKLKTEALDLAGVFEKIFFVLDDAREVVDLWSEMPGSDVLERGSVRLGPIEPLIPSGFFHKLPASAFDDAELPLWLRDEIFDQTFYTGKI